MATVSGWNDPTTNGAMPTMPASAAPKVFDGTRSRQTVFLNRDIIKLFSGLRVSDSFLLHNNRREILFRKPA